jgi:hypothetical protein
MRNISSNVKGIMSARGRHVFVRDHALPEIVLTPVSKVLATERRALLTNWKHSVDRR